MKEISDIIRAYRSVQDQGKAMALATVVAVEGSSYRREGARMLIDEDGRLTGAISGGCLEGDALRRARLVMAAEEPLLVTYDTTDEADAAIGLQLGCNGIVHVLIEPIKAGEGVTAIDLLAIIREKREPAMLVTFFSMKDRKHPAAGTRLLLGGKEVWTRGLSEALKSNAVRHCQDLDLSTGKMKSEYQTYGELTAFYQAVSLPLALIIVGAGNDAIPLQQMALMLGWEVTVVDGRPGYLTAARFPAARLVVSAAAEVSSKIEIDRRTAIVLMSHNYNYDRAVLKQALNFSFRYLGSLGPRKKFFRMLEELKEEGTVIPEEVMRNLYGPVGIDIGSETAEEIALSVVAEIQAVFSEKAVPSLREKTISIHS
ncbi:XdhC family protein [Arcticibacter sp. MXS-1]|uniref:XdhC family protein n=1 Tax=Arcticibacter sp. MXS-1 TaxID=3341726 RepID=UPI0035A88B78